MLGRGVLRLTNEEPRMRTLQSEFMAGDVRDGMEHFEPYGYTSRAHPGAEVVAGFFQGDRSHGVVLVTADRRYRLHVEEGEVAIFDDLDQKVHLKRDRIEVRTPLNFTGYVGGDADIEVVGNVRSSVGGSVDASVDGPVTLDAKSTLTATVADTSSITCPTINITSDAVSITGTLKVGGLITGNGGIVVSGGSGATVTGSFTLNGGLTASDDVVASGISLVNHTHIEKGDGAPTSPPQ